MLASTALEFMPNGQQENEQEYVDEQDNNADENEQNGLFRQMKVPDFAGLGVGISAIAIYLTAISICNYKAGL